MPLNGVAVVVAVTVASFILLLSYIIYSSLHDTVKRNEMKWAITQ